MINGRFTAVLAAVMVGIWGHRGIFVVLLVAIVASVAELATIRVERPTPQMAPATPVDVAVTAP